MLALPITLAKIPYLYTIFFIINQPFNHKKENETSITYQSAIYKHSSSVFLLMDVIMV